MYGKELQTLGLSEKEAAVYLAALELGPETVQHLARRAGVNRPTAYVQIESLKQKGLVSEVERGKKTLFMAESPERLKSLLNVAEKEIDFKRAEVERVLPGLQELFASRGEKPRVRFFEGKEAAKAMADEYLKVKNKKIESFINLDRVLDIFPKHLQDYTPRRIAKGIRGYVIYNRAQGPLPELNDPAKLRQAKYISAEVLPILADIDIFDDKVSLATYKEKPINVLIESKEITETLRGIFYFTWNKLD